MKKIISSESVGIGHPDKTCDTIADAFLDEALRQDPNSQMAVECAIKNDKLFIYGEATTRAKIDYGNIAKEILKDIGYKNEFIVTKEISIQSPDISQAVIKKETMANDQGIVFGYATDETKEYMPLPIIIAHKLMRNYEKLWRKDGRFHSDAKSQVAVEYDDDEPKKFISILLSVSHEVSIAIEQIKMIVMEQVVKPTLGEYENFLKGDIEIIINPSEKFTVWGSFGDSGCVGRKIVVDSYGGVGKVGGGCFSSKNASKVDRSGAYYARYVAKNIVANKLAKKCEIQVAYAIGLGEPTSIFIDTFGTENVKQSEIEKFVKKHFSFRPQHMIDELGLLRPIYRQTACYGHFGCSDYPWEKIKIFN